MDIKATVHNASAEDMRKTLLGVREKFIAERALYEKQFNDWYTNLLKCPKLIEQIPFDVKGWSIKEMVPELYVEYPNEEVCNSQMDALEDKIRQIDEIVHGINLVGHQKYQEYLALTKK